MILLFFKIKGSFSYAGSLVKPKFMININSFVIKCTNEKKKL